MSPIAVPRRLADDIAAVGISGSWVNDTSSDGLDSTKGAYLLVLRLSKTTDVAISPKTSRQLASGWYVYAGNAWGSGGIRARIKRHFRSAKTVHWHIDQLTVDPAGMAALIVAGGHECELVGQLLESPRFKVAAAGFGSTDCRRCESHLVAASAAT